jgi:hypothetical protein
LTTPWTVGKESDLSDDPYEVADELGLEVLVPKADELFIDIDTDAQAAQLDRQLAVLASNKVHATVTRMGPSRTAGHLHAVVKLDREVTPTERILLQAVLGSGPKRELLSWLRIHTESGREPTVFFEEKEAA